MVRPERRASLTTALDDLRRYRSGHELGQFLVSRDLQRLVMHALYVAVQASIDEALELCSERGISVRTYRDAFLELGRAGALDAALAARLSDWAAFRNVLAHFYPVIDLRRVWAAIDQIGDLEDFLRIVGASRNA
jgi:uncharacterized protein YutE (UPF0331/DUF86 family)